MVWVMRHGLGVLGVVRHDMGVLEVVRHGAGVFRVGETWCGWCDIVWACWG